MSEKRKQPGVNIRLKMDPIELEKLQRGYKSIYAASNRAASWWYYLRKKTLFEIAPIFSEDEKLLIKKYYNAKFSPSLAHFNPDSVIGCMLDNGFNDEPIFNKIRELTGAQLFFLLESLE